MNLKTKGRIKILTAIAKAKKGQLVNKYTKAVKPSEVLTKKDFEKTKHNVNTGYITSSLLTFKSSYLLTIKKRLRAIYTPRLPIRLPTNLLISSRLN